MRRYCALTWQFVSLLANAAGQFPVCRSAILVLALAVLGGKPATALPPVQMPPPTIASFAAAYVGGDVWVVAGQVVDPYPDSVVVYFGGLLAGCWADVGPDGSFYYTVVLPPGASGQVTAIAVDGMGLVSSVKNCYIDNE